MKKVCKIMFLMLCVVSLLVGCGSSSTKNSDDGFKKGEKGEVSNKYIKVSKYLGLEIEKVEPAAVTDEDVNAAIQSDLTTEWEKTGIKDRAAKDGDTVIIDYVGKKDGVAFAGGTANDSPLTLGSNKFIEGFEAKIVGHKPGETFDLNLTFPEKYHSEELAGQAVVFTVTLDAIVATELTEEMVPLLSETAKTVAEYREQVRANLVANNEETAESSMKASVLPALYKVCTVETYPEKELAEQTEDATEYYTAEYNAYMSYVASMSGTTVEEAISSSGMTMESYVEAAYGAKIEDIAKIQCTVNMAIDLVARAEGIKVTEELIKAYVEEQAARRGEEPDTYRSDFVKQNGEEMLKELVLQNTVIEFLWENSVVVEPAKTTDSTTAEE